MNSYNENLYSTVSTSLLNLELDEKNVKSQLDASMFTLYYAQGARITAAEKLDWANNTYKFQQDVNEQAVNNNNIAVNLLYSASQQKSYTAQSVTNAAVCAANVQVAANAVLRLASDMGSIYSMLSAADFGSEIYLQSRTAYSIMNETAYDAEKASQSAMDASTATAEVSASTVADEANVTNTSITGLFAVTGADFNAISAIVATNNADLSTASAAEKVAEGSLEMVNVEYFATRSAYVLNNKELNLDLSVSALNFDYIDADKRENDTYQVTFSYYKSPFSAQQVELLNPDNKGVKKVIIPAGYPVKEYHVILVKDSKKTIFSIATAESVLLYRDRSVEVPSVPQLLGQKQAEVRIHRLDLKDSDGEKMELGQKYVVFVLAVLTDDYKKSINIFDDYLTAPSAYFKLTNHLLSPAADSIKVNPANTQLKFKIEKTTHPSEYRCMFLPDNTAQINGLLSASALRSIEQEAEKLEKVAREFDPKITEAEAALADLVVTHEGLLSKHDELSGKEAGDDSENTATEMAAIKPRLQTLPDEITDAQKTVKNLHQAKDIAMRSVIPAADVKPGFFFNRKLAEQVSHANYWIADVDANSFGTVSINDTTTDNFGNLLIKGKTYIPVVLTVAKVSEDNMGKYTNSISDFESTASFPEKISKK